jgi:hypothetical protein
MQNKNRERIFSSFSDMNMSDIREFRTTWKRDLFLRNKSTCFTAKCLIKKSIVIGKHQSFIQLFCDHIFL